MGVEKMTALNKILEAMNHLKIRLDMTLAQTDASERQLLFKQAAHYRDVIVKERSRLLQMPMTPSELQIFDFHREVTEHGLTAQLLFEEVLMEFQDINDATVIMQEQVNQYQNRSQQILSQYQIILNAEMTHYLDHFREQMNDTDSTLDQQFWLAMGLSLMIGLVVLSITSRQNQFIFKQYQRLKQQAQMLEDKVIQRTQHLHEMTKKAEAASEAKSEFLAVMSHEIRTPLNGVLGTLHLLGRTQLDDKQQRYLGTTLHSSELLLAIINDILDYSKIESGNLSLHPHPLDVRQFISDMEMVYRPLAENKGLELLINLDELDYPLVLADKTRLQQILNNYLNNALKFTESGYIQIKLKTLKDGHLYLEVKDSGIGIQQEDIDKLFRDFSQVESGANRHFGGTGLGLAICKRLAQLMGGNVDVSSIYGQGSTFCACLNLTRLSVEEFDYKTLLLEQQSNYPSPAESSRTTTDPSQWLIGAKRLLLVEDNELNQTIATELLQDEGYEVFVANNGVEAIDILSQHQDFDLVLMDCHMPVMNGYQACTRLRDMGINLPVIALTANAQESDKQRCYECGMNDFLSKPFNPTALYQIVNKWINQPTPIQ